MASDGYTGFQTYQTGQGFNNHQNVNVGSNWSNNNTWGNNNVNLGLNATMSPNGGNQNNFYGNFGSNHNFQIGIPNFGGQACPGLNNTNIFQNSNSMGGTNAFSQGPTYPNNCWNNNLGSYGNGPVPSMNPTNQFNNNCYNGGSPFNGINFQNWGGNQPQNNNWGEDSDEEDADDEEEIEPEVIQQDPDENTFHPNGTEGATHLICCEEKWEQEKLQWHSKLQKLFLCTTVIMGGSN
eukprot:Gb_26725 [translate_table: standard]